MVGPGTWRTAEAKARLAPDSVEVWRVPLDVGAREIERATATLSADELERANRYRVPDDRRRFVLARSAARFLCARELGIRAEQVSIVEDSDGKPSLTSGALHFNVSHSMDIGLIAIGIGRRLGVDVERIREDLEIDALASRFLTRRELACLRAAVDPGAKRRLFFALWSRKEALTKGLGRGLAQPLEGIGIDSDDWTIRDVPEIEGYSGAVAVEGVVDRFLWLQW